MSIDIRRAIENAGATLATGVGLGLIVAYFLTSIVSTVGQHNLMAADFESMLVAIEDMDPEAAAEITPEIEQALAELHFAVGLSGPTAVFVWLIGAVLTAFVAVGVLRAGAMDNPTFDPELVDEIGWGTLNLFVGTIVFGVLLLVGLLLFILPG